MNIIELAAKLPCNIELPRDMQDFFDGPIAVMTGEDDQRRYKRVDRRTIAAFRFERPLPGKPRDDQWRRIYLKDFSQGGAGFIADEQLYPGECVRLAFGGPNDTPVIQIVEVIRCRKAGRYCYIIGGQFVSIT